MAKINGAYGRDLDLNLLRVFAIVAEEQNLTRAAARLYVTQPAVSAAMQRLTAFVGAELVTRQAGRMVLTTRGKELLSATRSHLAPLVSAATSSVAFDPLEAERTMRLGLGDGLEFHLLPRLASKLAERAPNLRLIVHSVQFRNVVELILDGKVDLAVTVTDRLPRAVLRRTIRLPAAMRRGFACVFDGQQLDLPASISEAMYFAQDHVIVSYAGDTRGIIEDETGKQRRVRMSVPAFSFLPNVLPGTRLLATVPWMVAQSMCSTHRRLRASSLPFSFQAGALQMIWTGVTDDDPGARFLRDTVANLLEKPEEPRILPAREQGPRKATRRGQKLRT